MEDSQDESVINPFAKILEERTQETSSDEKKDEVEPEEDTEVKSDQNTPNSIEAVASVSSDVSTQSSDVEQVTVIQPVKQKKVVKSSKGRVSRTNRAEIAFPVGRVERQLRLLNIRTRVTKSAPVYLAAALEYLTKEILALAIFELHHTKRKRIKPVDIQRAIFGDAELEKLVQGCTFREGGVTSFDDPSRLLDFVSRRKTTKKPKKIDAQVSPVIPGVDEIVEQTVQPVISTVVENVNTSISPSINSSNEDAFDF
jgi:histone H2A